MLYNAAWQSVWQPQLVACMRRCTCAGRLHLHCAMEGNNSKHVASSYLQHCHLQHSAEPVMRTQKGWQPRLQPSSVTILTTTKSWRQPHCTTCPMKKVATWTPLSKMVDIDPLTNRLQLGAAQLNQP